MSVIQRQECQYLFNSYLFKKMYNNIVNFSFHQCQKISIKIENKSIGRNSFDYYVDHKPCYHQNNSSNEMKKVQTSLCSHT